MNKQELMKYVAEILTTLRETATGCPESTLYMALGMDMSKWEVIRGILLNAGFVNIRSYYVTLTSKGEETADKLTAVMA